MFGAIRTTAQSLGVEVSPVSTLNAGEIERGVAVFARTPNGGLIVTPNASVSVYRADRHACSPTQAARSLSLPLPRGRRWPYVLWTEYY
jgi:hypothetical protein